MMNYITRALAGGVIGYIFGLLSALGIWLALNGGSEGLISFLFVMAVQSALIGVTAGLVSAGARNWAILGRTVPAGMLAGVLLILFLAVLAGHSAGPEGEYLLGARSASNTASINMVWGALVGLIVGLCFLPFYRSEPNQSPLPTSQDQACSHSVSQESERQAPQ